MCQGLPCVGARVELTRTFRTPEGEEIKLGTRGVIKEEHRIAREVTVDFPELRRTARIPENYLKAL